MVGWPNTEMGTYSGLDTLEQFGLLSEQSYHVEEVWYQQGI